MNKFMNSINNGSICKIYFDGEKNKIDKDKLGYINMVFAGDGVFMVQNSRLGITYDRLSFPYKNSSLNKYGFDWAWESHLPKAPQEMLETILDCFKYVVGKTSDELLIIIYWDTIKKQHIFDIVKVQIISKGFVKYAYNEKYEMDERYIKYLEIHSHNTMAANFSSVDDNDEKKTVCMYGVLGHINVSSSIMNVSKSFRIWTGKQFRQIGMEEVFDIQPIETQLPKNITKQLDSIIHISKVIKEMKTKQNPIAQSALTIIPKNNSNVALDNNSKKDAMAFLSMFDDPDDIPDNKDQSEKSLDELISEIFGKGISLDDLDDDELEELGGHAGIDWTNFESTEREDMTNIIRGQLNVTRNVS